MKEWDQKMNYLLWERQMSELERKAERIVEDIIEDFNNFSRLNKSWKRLSDFDQESVKNVWKNLVLNELVDPSVNR